MHTRVVFARTDRQMEFSRWLCVDGRNVHGYYCCCCCARLGERERTKRTDRARRSSPRSSMIYDARTRYLLLRGSRTRDDDTVRKVQYGRTSINPIGHCRSSDRRQRLPCWTTYVPYGGGRRSLWETRSPAKSNGPGGLGGKDHAHRRDGRTNDYRPRVYTTHKRQCDRIKLGRLYGV